ncbi:MAG: hypothetical protein K6E26_09290 [Clostridiales bacterium]|nr:hypothetical protein [Clostridiales bacterium]
MNTSYRTIRTLALLMIFSLVISSSGCNKIPKNTETEMAEVFSSVSESVTEKTADISTSSETTEMLEMTTMESPVESTSESVSLESSDAEIVEGNTSETTISHASEPDKKIKKTATPTPSKAPKPVSKETATLTSTCTPTQVSATATPTPAVSTKTFPPPENSKSIAIKAMKAAIKDCCQSHSISYTDENGKTVTIPFQFTDAVMTNCQTRADYMTKNNVMGHLDIPGTWSGLEAVGGMGTILSMDGGELHWLYYWTDEYTGENHYYESFYECVYTNTKSLIVDHTEKLSTDSGNVCYGVGFSSAKDPVPSYEGFDIYELNYGVKVEYMYSYVLVVNGCDDFSIAVHGLTYDYTIE